MNQLVPDILLFDDVGLGNSGFDRSSQQRQIVEAAYPVLEKARNQRLLVSSQLEDLLDTVKDSEFSLLDLEDES